MAIDAKFDKIQKIIPIESADSLELAIVSNFPCVVRKGEFKDGDWSFYIREDASLIGWKERKDRINRDTEAAKSGDFVTQDCFQCTFTWQTPLLKYLGTNGRVKVVKLRGKVSSGILLKPNTVCPNIPDVKFSDAHAEFFNKSITDPETGAVYLERNFGIKHWERPIEGCSMGTLNARSPLAFGLSKTDEENFQNIEDCMFPWNEEVLITKKLDGSSCSIASTPGGDIHVMSRSQDLVLEDDNIWNRAAKSVIPLVKALAKHYNETVVVRGEVTGAGINASKVNLDCKGDAAFNMFSVVFPDADDYKKKIGLYGTDWHFLKVNEVCKKITGYEIKTVPVEGTAILTRKLLEDISDRPRSDGEGRVINTKSVDLPHFKSKSKDYLIHLG